MPRRSTGMLALFAISIVAWPIFSADSDGDGQISLMMKKARLASQRLQTPYDSEANAAVLEANGTDPAVKQRGRQPYSAKQLQLAAAASPKPGKLANPFSKNGASSIYGYPPTPLPNGNEHVVVDTTVEIIADLLYNKYFCGKRGDCSEKSLVRKLEGLRRMPFSEKEALASELREPSLVNIINTMNRDVDEYMPDLSDVVAKMYTAKEIANASNSFKYAEMISMLKDAVSEYLILRPNGPKQPPGERPLKLLANKRVPQPFD